MVGEGGKGQGFGTRSSSATDRSAFWLAQIAAVDEDGDQPALRALSQFQDNPVEQFGCVNYMDSSARPWREIPLVASYYEIDTRGFSARQKVVVAWIWQTGSERLRLDLLALTS